MSEKQILTGALSEGYGIVPKKMMKDKNITIYDKAVLCYMLSYTGSGNTCFPSYASMIEHLGISKPTLSKSIKSLQESGYLEVSRLFSDPMKHNNKYKIVFLSNENDLDGHFGEPTRYKEVNPRGINRFTSNNNNNNNNNNNKEGAFSNENAIPINAKEDIDLDNLNNKDNTKPKTKNKIAPDDAAPSIDHLPEYIKSGCGDEFNNDKFIGAVKEFYSYRKKIKKPYKTKMGFNMLLNKLYKMGADKAVTAIGEAIEKEWMGVYEPKETTQYGQKKPGNIREQLMQKYGDSWGRVVKAKHSEFASRGLAYDFGIGQAFEAKFTDYKTWIDACRA